MDNRTSRMTSSITAVASTIRANEVSKIPRSNMIREMTGMLVTAIVMEKTRKEEGVESGLCRPEGVMSLRKIIANTKGITVPSAAMRRTVLPSLRWKEGDLVSPMTRG
jgi:hypothetical protein